MPRSFLVKKYLKQKYDADTLLQALNAQKANENAQQQQQQQQQRHVLMKQDDNSNNINSKVSDSADSRDAVTPYTPRDAAVQSLAVKLSNGYFLDVTHSRLSAHSSDPHIARTPQGDNETAAQENHQPRRSVIVSNFSHPAHRNVHQYDEHSLDRDYAFSRVNQGSMGVIGPHDVYCPPRSTYAHSVSDSAPLDLTPRPAHTPSPIPQPRLINPTPAHTPFTTHQHPGSSPRPAHQSPPPAHQPITAALPVDHHAYSIHPAHNSETFQSDRFITSSPHLAQHTELGHYEARPIRSPPPHYKIEMTSPKQEESQPAELPADNPLHHPLIQHYINQRLQVPEESEPQSPHILQHNSPYRPHEDHQESPMDEDVNPPRFRVEDYEGQPLYYQPRPDHAVHDKSSDTDMSQTSLNYHTAFPYPPEGNSQLTHFPPSPSPSLPSSSPTLPPSNTPRPPPSPSSVHSPPPSSPEPSLNSSSSEVSSYTYEAFLISDGRSRKRSVKEKAPGKVRYTCSECGKDYATSSNLSRHKQTHRSLDSQSAKKCPHCDKVYVSMPALSMHILTHDLKHACKVCGKTFSRPWLLQGHMRSHTGEKPFGCAHCGKAFADRSNLRAHMQTHSAFKHFACNKCDRTFALKSYLNKHLESSCQKDGNEQ